MPDPAHGRCEWGVLCSMIESGSRGMLLRNMDSVWRTYSTRSSLTEISRGASVGISVSDDLCGSKAKNLCERCTVSQAAQWHASAHNCRDRLQAHTLGHAHARPRGSDVTSGLVARAMPLTSPRQTLLREFGASSSSSGAKVRS